MLRHVVQQDRVPGEPVESRHERFDIGVVRGKQVEMIRAAEITDGPPQRPHRDATEAGAMRP